jgi:hypothetical protein
MELLDELVPRDTRPADWQDVLRRARPARPRARIVAALAVAIAALAGAPALAVLLRADNGPALPAQADRSRVYILRAPGTQRVAVKVAPWRGHDGICFAAVIGRRACASTGTAFVGLNAGYTFDRTVVAGTAIKPGSGRREPLDLLPLRKLGVTFFFAKSGALRLLWRVELRDAAGKVVHTLTNRRQH